MDMFGDKGNQLYPLKPPQNREICVNYCRLPVRWSEPSFTASWTSDCLVQAFRAS